MNKSGFDLNAHPWRDKFVVRDVRWDSSAPGRTDILDAGGRVVSTLQEPYTLFFRYAEGDRPVAALIAWAADRFDNAIPVEMGMTILQELVERLKVLKLCDAAQAIPYIYDLPVREQDPAEAQRAMERGGWGD